MAYNVLVASRSVQLVLDEWRPRLEAHGLTLVVPPTVQRLSEAQLLQYVADVDGVLAGDDYFTAEVLANAPKLKVISKWGTGLDSIDRAACAERGIAVYNTPDAFTDPVADSTLAALLTVARQVREIDADLRAGVWQKYQHRALREYTLAIIGLGRIGRAVAERAAPFGLKILGVDPQAPPADWLASTGVTLGDLATVLPQADFVSLHCDLNPTSEQLINQERLGAFKPTAWLLNFARGKVVDEAALVAALEQQQLAGAALDVFVEEPLPATSRLRSRKNVILSPHCAGTSPAAYQAVCANTINNLLVGLQLVEPLASVTTAPAH